MFIEKKRESNYIAINLKIAIDFNFFVFFFRYGVVFYVRGYFSFQKIVENSTRMAKGQVK